MGENIPIELRWCNQVRENVYQNNAMICGRGGDTTTGVLKRLADLYSVGITSQTVIVLIGTNQRSDAALTKWKIEIEKIHQVIVANGAVPIICVPTIPETGEAYVFKMRDYILAKGWETIRFDLATSLNQDGASYNSSLYNDGVHPNDKGSQVMADQALLELRLLKTNKK